MRESSVRQPTLLLLALASLGLGVAAPTGVAAPVEEFRLHGQVTDPSGVPLAEAQVSLRDPLVGISREVQSVKTDSQGRWVMTAQLPLQDLRQGWTILSVTAWAPGLMRVVRGVRWDQSPREREIDFALAPETVLTGQVLDVDGRPLAGAEVLADGSLGQVPIETLGLGRADAQGMFALGGLAPGCVRVSVARPGGLFENTGTQRAGEQPITIRLQPEVGVVTGRVEGAVSHEPRADVEVWLGDEVNGAAARRTRTDAEGRFRFDHLPTQSWEVRLAGPQRARAYVSLDAGRTASICTLLVPEPIVLAGVVREAETGTSVPDFGLRVWGEDEHDAVRVRTDSHGRFVASRVEPTTFAWGSSMVEVACEDDSWIFSGGEKARYFQLSSSQGEKRDIELRVLRGEPLEISAVDPSGEALADFHWIILGLGEQRRAHAGDSEGQTTAHAPRPPWLGRAVAWGSSGDWPFLSAGPFDLSTSAITLRTPRMTNLRVQVLDQGGAPISSAVVQAAAVRECEGRMPSFDSVAEIRSVPVDSQGRALLSRLPRTPVLVRARVPGSDQPVLRVVDLAGASAPSAVTLQVPPPPPATVTVTGRVVTDHHQPIAGARVMWTWQAQNWDPYWQRWTRVQPDGSFSFTDNSNYVGYGVTARADGYLPQDGVIIRPTEREAEIVLHPEVTFTGVLVRPDGSHPPWYQPLSLWLPAEPDTWGARWTLETCTNQNLSYYLPDGRFTWTPPRVPSRALPGSAGVMGLTASGEFATASATLSGQPPQWFDLGRLVLWPGHTLTGTVRSASGEALEGATVLWQNPGSWADSLPGPPRWSAVTDSSGHFTLAPLPLGRWSIAVTADRHLPHAFDVQITGDASREFILTPHPGVPVTVTVKGTQGQPLPGIWVSVSRQSARSSALAQFWTDSAGVARADGISPGPQRLSLRIGETYLRQSVDVGDQGAELTIDTSAWPVVSGHVTLAGGPAVGYRVSVGDDDGVFSAETAVGLDGSYSVRVPAGICTVSVADPSRCYPLASRRLDLIHDETCDLALWY